MIKCLDLLKINSCYSSIDLWFGIVNLDLNCIYSCCPIALSMVDSASSASVPIVQPWENASSPYFLSNSDNPGMSLVVQHLTKENYNTWSREILISLDVKTKIGFIDGSIPKPQSVDHPCYAAWCKCNSIVLIWLFNSISRD